jgi:choline dehydrogenase-like flavoprotein
VLAAGAIGTPSILLRSDTPDLRANAGLRTFLHPSLISAAIMQDKVEGHTGAPQTIYSDHFLDTLALDGPMGYKLEAPPLHPLLTSITLPGYGADHAAWMKRFNQMQVLIALTRDGFHPLSVGGTVKLRKDGSPLLHYDLNDYFWDAARRSLLTMAEIQFAAGAKYVVPMHNDGRAATSFAAAKTHIESLRYGTTHVRVASAHVMGGAAMGANPDHSVTDHQGRHHRVSNLSVHDGSLFPTSIGANPQLSIYGLAARNSNLLVKALRG